MEQSANGRESGMQAPEIEATILQIEGGTYIGQATRLAVGQSVGLEARDGSKYMVANEGGKLSTMFDGVHEVDDQTKFIRLSPEQILAWHGTRHQIHAAFMSVDHGEERHEDSEY